MKEYAISKGREQAALESLRLWREREQERLRGDIDRLTRLDAAWANCRLRRHVERKATGKVLPGATETRILPMAPLRGIEKPATARLARDGLSSFKLTGYAAVYNATADLYDFTEEIVEGAFDNVLRDDVRGLVNHNSDLIFARTTNDTLRLSSDRVGLRFSADLIEDDALSHTLINRVRTAIWSQCSFSFAVDVATDEWVVAPNGDAHRKITKILQLFDISVVTFPAYAETSVWLVQEPRAAEPKSDEEEPEDYNPQAEADRWFNEECDERQERWAEEERQRDEDRLRRLRAVEQRLQRSPREKELSWRLDDLQRRLSRNT